MTSYLGNTLLTYYPTGLQVASGTIVKFKLLLLQKLLSNENELMYLLPTSLWVQRYNGQLGNRALDMKLVHFFSTLMNLFSLILRISLPFEGDRIN